MKTLIERVREYLIDVWSPCWEFQKLFEEQIKDFETLIREDERKSFYGQDKPDECVEGCPPNKICDYCQVVAPVREMILAEREACASLVENCHPKANHQGIATAIRTRSIT